MAMKRARRRMSLTGAERIASPAGMPAGADTFDVKKGSKKLQLSVGTMGLQLFAGGKPLENMLYAKMQGWAEDEAGGSGLRIELTGSDKPVTLKTDSAATLSAVLAKMTEHATALAKLQKPVAPATASIGGQDAAAQSSSNGGSDANRGPAPLSPAAGAQMYDVKKGSKKLQLSVGTMGLQLFAGGKPLENMLYAKMQGWAEDEAGGSGLRIELTGSDKPVTLKTDSAATLSAVLAKMTEHATALAKLQKPVASTSMLKHPEQELVEDSEDDFQSISDLAAIEMAYDTDESDGTDGSYLLDSRRSSRAESELSAVLSVATVNRINQAEVPVAVLSAPLEDGRGTEATGGTGAADTVAGLGAPRPSTSTSSSPTSSAPTTADVGTGLGAEKSAGGTVPTLAEKGSLPEARADFESTSHQVLRVAADVALLKDAVNGILSAIEIEKQAGQLRRTGTETRLRYSRRQRARRADRGLAPPSPEMRGALRASENEWRANQAAVRPSTPPADGPATAVEMVDSLLARIRAASMIAVDRVEHGPQRLPEVAAPAAPSLRQQLSSAAPDLTTPSPLPPTSGAVPSLAPVGSDALLLKEMHETAAASALSPSHVPVTVPSRRRSSVIAFEEQPDDEKLGPLPSSDGPVKKQSLSDRRQARSARRMSLGLAPLVPTVAHVRVETTGLG